MRHHGERRALRGVLERLRAGAEVKMALGPANVEAGDTVDLRAGWQTECALVVETHGLMPGATMRRVTVRRWQE